MPKRLMTNGIKTPISKVGNGKVSTSNTARKNIINCFKTNSQKIAKAQLKPIRGRQILCSSPPKPVAVDLASARFISVCALFNALSNSLSFIFACAFSSSDVWSSSTIFPTLSTNQPPNNLLSIYLTHLI